MGVAFLPPNHYRQLLAPLQAALRDGAPRADVRAGARPLLRGAAAGAKLLILSDENILGILPRVARRGRLYPWAPGRVGRSLTVLGPRRIAVFLCIRNVADFLPSAYGESLRHNRFQTFEEFCAAARPEDLSWARLVEDIRPRLRGAPLTVWRYEDYCALRLRIVEALIGAEPPEDFEFLERRPRPGLSARAVEELLRLHAAGRDVKEEALVAAMADTYPKGASFPAFDPLSEATKNRCAELYRSDWDAISRMEGVSVLETGTNAR